MKLKTLTQEINYFYGRRSRTAAYLLPIIHTQWKSSRMDPENYGAFRDWLDEYTALTGDKWAKIEKGLRSSWGKIVDFDNPQDFLFCLKTYYVLVIKELASAALSQKLSISAANMSPSQRFQTLVAESGLVIEDFPDPFQWIEKAFPLNDMTDIFTLTTRRGLSSLIQYLRPDLFGNMLIASENDVLIEFYQDLFPKNVRHALGEYYTPFYITDILLSRIDFHHEKSYLDPACGSGVFLVNIARRMLHKEVSLAEIVSRIEGYDINPLAILSSTVNLIFALSELLPAGERIRIPVHMKDSLFVEEPPSLFNMQNRRFDTVIGNPPWISWKHISPTYKRRLAELAKPYEIFAHKGLKARLGFAQDDISVLFTYVSVDRFLKDSGQLGFVLPHTLLKTEGGGKGFRNFRIPKGNTHFGVDGVDDMSGINIFGTSSSKAMIFTATRGRRTEYPVPYKLWIKSKSRLIDKDMKAEPIDDHNSAWITAQRDSINIVKDLSSPSHYRARAGVCTWASGIYWVEPLEISNGIARIRNYTASSRQIDRTVETEIEAELLYPMIRGKELRRWHNERQLWMINVQNMSGPAKPVDEKLFRSEFPLTFQYLYSFKDYLLSRKGYKKYLVGMPFYSVYDIGPYTFSPYKVCWKYLDKDMNASVLTPFRDQPVLPDLNVITIPTESSDEAHYVAAMLNSPPIRLIVHSYGLCTRIAPGIMSRLPIPRYDPRSSLHKDLVRISESLHHTPALSIEDELATASTKILKIHNRKKEIITQLKEFIL